MSEPILARPGLDALRCSCGSHACHGVVFHSKCHPRAATWVAYVDGVVTVSCCMCDRTVVKIAVADEHAAGHLQ